VNERDREPGVFARSLFAGLPRRYDRLAEILSLGQNRRWRRAMVDQVVGGPVAGAGLSRILDVATGPAGVARQIAERSRAHVVGIDLSEPMLREGLANVARAGQRDRIALVLGRGEELPFPDRSFDALTFTYLLRYVADPAATLEELARVVKPGGAVASLEFAVPTSPVWRALWWLYTRGVLPVAGLVTGGRAWFDVGRFLGPNITGHYERYPVDATVAAWEKAGINDVSVRRMSLGGGIVMWGRKAP
jgi:demethylmenaquinone methyltransferase / 2-methoxy-6-polyprenyl-1,4-benzoquinol methylase